VFSRDEPDVMVEKWAVEMALGWVDAMVVESDPSWADASVDLL
jgi:hypothetical protein